MTFFRAVSWVKGGMGCLAGSLSAILGICKHDGVITSVIHLRHAVTGLHLSPIGWYEFSEQLRLKSIEDLSWTDGVI